MRDAGEAEAWSPLGDSRHPRLALIGTCREAGELPSHGDALRPLCFHVPVQHRSPGVNDSSCRGSLARAANASPMPYRFVWILVDERLGQSSDSRPEGASGAFCEPRDAEDVPCSFRSRWGSVVPPGSRVAARRGNPPRLGRQGAELPAVPRDVVQPWKPLLTWVNACTVRLFPHRVYHVRAPTWCDVLPVQPVFPADVPRVPRFFDRLHRGRVRERFRRLQPRLASLLSYPPCACI